jgi:hypothetical protein
MLCSRSQLVGAAHLQCQLAAYTLTKISRKRRFCTTQRVGLDYSIEVRSFHLIVIVSDCALPFKLLDHGEIYVNFVISLPWFAPSNNFNQVFGTSSNFVGITSSASSPIFNLPSLIACWKISVTSWKWLK